MSVIRKKLIRRTYPLEREAEFAAYHPVLRRVYAARAVDPKTLDRTLDTLLPYHLLSDIDRAVELLTAAIIQQKNILIIGDFDTDGATSTALAVRALRLFGTTNVQYLVPNRFNDGYGLTPALLLRAKLFNPQLIVTVDNGIAHHAGVLAAIALGIEVVITDHHLPAPRLPLPEADAIV
ncbi:MAG: single-stranded-DNA-specific exonuclease RecJ, partial [uncultured bacterium]